MNAEQTRKNARHHGVNLFVPKDEDVIRAKPMFGFPEKLKEAIRENKDVLMRDLLMEQALAYLDERYVKGADLSRLKEPGERVDATYPLEVPLAEYRAALREYVQAGLREFQRVKRGEVA